MGGAMAMGKYHSRKTVVDGITFDSRREAMRYQELRLLERAGKVRNLRRQVKYNLIPAQLDSRGQVVEKPVTYVADFVYELLSDGGTFWVPVVEDAKGVRTPVYIIKRKLMLERYGIRIREV